jgi:6-phosphogluconolactonase
MKWTNIGQGFLVAALSLGLGLGITSCSSSDTIDYLFVTSNSSSGQVTSYHVDSQSGALSEVTGSPFSSGGNNPVSAVASPNGQFLYVANHDSNSIAELVIGTNGQLSMGHTYSTPGSEPVSMTMNAAGTLLFVVDYYAPGFSDTTPGPGALVVFPINSDGSLGSAVATGGVAYSSLDCFPTGVSVSANGDFVYVTNTNSVIVTTAAPATTPATPAGCPTQGTISGFSIASGGALTAVSGSPFAAGTTPTGIAIDPTSRFLYATDSAQNQLIVYSILSTGVLIPRNNGPFTTGTFPVAVVVDPRGQFLYVTNYNGETISEYAISQATGIPSAGASGAISSGAPGPTCILVDPALGRFVYTSDYVGSYIGGTELNPNTGALSVTQGAPYPSVGKPTCVAAVPHGNHATQYVSSTAGQ